METLASILVATDLSDHARPPLAHAARVARANASTLHVVHLVESLTQTPALAGAAVAEPQLTGVLETEARRRVDALLPEDDRPEAVEIAVRVGPPIPALLEVQQQTSADLVVLGSRCRPESGRSFAHLARDAVRRVPVPTVVVRDTHANPFRHVMACVDLTRNSFRALREGVRFAQLNGARLTIAHVYRGPWRTMHYRSPTPEASPDFKSKHKEKLRAKLARVVAPYAEAAPDVRIHQELVDAADQVEGIRRFVEKHDVDLTVLAMRKRNLRVALFGSTTEGVLRDCGASVLAVKPMEREVVHGEVAAQAGRA